MFDFILMFRKLFQTFLRSMFRVTPFRQLTSKPPPTSPPMYFTSSVMCPSWAYLMSPSGKNSTMLQMMDMSASGYRVTAMQREHFPVHMSESKAAPSASDQLSKSFLHFCFHREVPPLTNPKMEVCLHWQQKLYTGRGFQVWEV